MTTRARVGTWTRQSGSEWLAVGECRVIHFYGPRSKGGDRYTFRTIRHEEIGRFANRPFARKAAAEWLASKYADAGTTPEADEQRINGMNVRHRIAKEAFASCP